MKPTKPDDIISYFSDEVFYPTRIEVTKGIVIILPYGINGWPAGLSQKSNPDRNTSPIAHISKSVSEYSKYIIVLDTKDKAAKRQSHH